ncbi:MAG: efflux RND transporter periplasmic adaptor subunit [Puniceicoccaceae bacterium]
MKAFRTILIFASLLLGVAVIAFAAWAFWGEQQEKSSGPQRSSQGAASMATPVRTWQVQASSFERRLVFNGTIRAREFIEITSEVAGRVANIHFEDGDVVQTGDLLVTLDDREPQAQARAVQEELELATLNADRLQVLWQSEGIPQRDLDEALSRKNVLAAQLENLKARIEKYRIVAPFSGKLGFREISLGASLQPGMRISTLQSIDPILIDFPVSERFRNYVREGVPVAARISGDEQTYEGSVFRLDPRIDSATRTVTVRGVFPNPEGALQPGGFARVQVNITTPDSVLVPATAVVRGLLDVAVFVVSDGKAERRVVEIGERTPTAVEVLSGLSEGEMLIVEGTQSVRNGASVRVVSSSDTVIEQTLEP